MLDVVAWSNESRNAVSGGMARAAVKLLRTVYNRMTEWGLFRGENPANHVAISGRSSRAIFVQEHEMPRLIETIMQQPMPDRLYFMTMLTLAPRPRERDLMKVHDIVLRRDRDVDVWFGSWTKPASTTKKNRRHVVPIPPKLAEMFASWIQLRGRVSDWMFPGRDGEPRSKQNWFYRWDEVRSQAGIPHIWLYDLRRTGATWANDETGNLSAVSRGMLGHATFEATNVYVQALSYTIKNVIGSHEQRLLGTVPPQAVRIDPFEETREEWPDYPG